MPRIRNIKPDTFDDPDLNALPVVARWLFVGLWTQADREGRLADETRRIKTRILPHDDEDVDALLSILAPKFITRYAVGGRKYIQVNNFARHQCVHAKEKPSTIPPCPEISGPAPELPAGMEYWSTGIPRVVEPPDPTLKPFVVWFAEEAERITGVPFAVEWHRDMRIVKDLRKVYSDRQLRELAWTFLHLADDWHDKIGRTIPSLKRQANVLAERRSKALYAAGVSDFTDAMLGLEPTT